MATSQEHIEDAEFNGSGQPTQRHQEAQTVCKHWGRSTLQDRTPIDTMHNHVHLAAETPLCAAMIFIAVVGQLRSCAQAGSYRDSTISTVGQGADQLLLNIDLQVDL